MIQIIGFLICACLAVKLLEISANSALVDREGKPHHNRTAALILGWPCVFVFALWLLLHGGTIAQPFETDAPPPISQEEIDCITNAKDADAIVACTS